MLRRLPEWGKGRPACRGGPKKLTYARPSLRQRRPPRREGWLMLLVPGGAGFIGSNVVASLNEAGRTDVVVNDLLGSAGKWRNLQHRQIADFVPPAELMRWLDGRKLDAVVHLGAISYTTAVDGD